MAIKSPYEKKNATLNNLKNQIFCKNSYNNIKFFEENLILEKTFNISNSLSTEIAKHLQTVFEFNDVIYTIHKRLNENTSNVKTLFKNFSIHRQKSHLIRTKSKIQILKFSSFLDFDIKNQIYILNIIQKIFYKNYYKPN